MALLRQHWLQRIAARGFTHLQSEQAAPLRERQHTQWAQGCRDLPVTQHPEGKGEMEDEMVKRELNTLRPE